MNSIDTDCPKAFMEPVYFGKESAGCRHLGGDLFANGPAVVAAGKGSFLALVGAAPRERTVYAAVRGTLDASIEDWLIDAGPSRAWAFVFVRLHRCNVLIRRGGGVVQR